MSFYIEQIYRACLLPLPCMSDRIKLQVTINQNQVNLSDFFIKAYY